jgi:putative hydrolase of the HAD superfamily
MKKKIGLITIDFWNTLFDSSGGTLRNAYRQRVLIDEFDKQGVLIKQDKFEDAMKSSWGYFNKIWKTEHRTPPPSDLVRFLWNYLELPKDEDALRRIVDLYAGSILVHRPRIIPDVKDAIEALSKDFKLAIISDTGFSPGEILKVLLRDNGIIEYFSAFSFSDETGVSKPHPKAYRKIFDELGFEPGNAIHIGDIEDTDIRGAKELGMYAIRFSGDSTALMNKENPAVGAADAECFYWNDIVDVIYELSGNHNL